MLENEEADSRFEEDFCIYLTEQFENKKELRGKLIDHLIDDLEEGIADLDLLCDKRMQALGQYELMTRMIDVRILNLTFDPCD